MMAELELKNVVKIYPFVNPKKHIFGRKRAEKVLKEQQKMPYLSNEGVIAVQKFSLRAERGDFVVLYGPSGCGKSTVLRMIAGLTDVTAGELFIDGEDMEGVMPELRNVAMVFQEYSLYPHFTVEENIAFPLRNLHIPREELERKTELMLRLLELTPVRHEKPANLSGGELQRTAIGRALIRRPEIFLMDEPFSNLDLPLRQKLRVLVKRVHQELGTTFVYVTHDINEALSLATRLVLMKDGMIVQQGAPDEVYRHPKNLTAAMMTGTPEINIFREACLIRDESGCMAVLHGKRFPCKEQRRLGPVILGVRPAQFTLSVSEGIPCRVLAREPVGSEMHLTLDHEGTEIRVVLEASEHVSALNPGDTVLIRPRMEEVLFFDPGTEALML